jgi:DeoR/GlpR family transcriptional regulator of sugar metabolism
MDRLNKILELVSEKKEMKTIDLIEYFNVSGATIRNDLARLEAQNLVKRIHGGVIYVERTTTMESFESFVSRSHSNVKEKQAIAKEAMKIVSDQSTIMFDASSTVLNLAYLLDSMKRLTIITNGVQTAIEVQKHNNFNVILIGGTLRNNSTAIEGIQGADLLNNLNADILFTSAHGFTIENGLTDFNIYEVELKRLMTRRAKRIIALLDHRKIGNSSTSSFCETKEIHTIITDELADKDYIEKIRNLGINVIVAKL